MAHYQSFITSIIQFNTSLMYDLEWTSNIFWWEILYYPQLSAILICIDLPMHIGNFKRWGVLTLYSATTLHVRIIDWHLQELSCRDLRSLMSRIISIQLVMIDVMSWVSFIYLIISILLLCDPSGFTMRTSILYFFL